MSNEAPESYRVEPQRGTSGMSEWRVTTSGDGPVFVVKLLGSILSKMEDLHHRKLTPSDIRVGIERAVDRARRELAQAPSAEPPEEISVMVRDSDLAELDGRVVGPTSGVPY